MMLYSVLWKYRENFLEPDKNRYSDCRLLFLGERKILYLIWVETCKRTITWGQAVHKRPTQLPNKLRSMLSMECIMMNKWFRWDKATSITASTRERNVGCQNVLVRVVHQSTESISDFHLGWWISERRHGSLDLKAMISWSAFRFILCYLVMRCHLKRMFSVPVILKRG